MVLLTGKPAPSIRAGAWTGAAPGGRYRVVTIGLTTEREGLYRALDARVDRMLADGLLDEVRGLLDAGIDPSLPAMQGIGYRQLVPVIRQASGLAPAVALMKQDTRRYAKRQWTWFAREPGLTWVSSEPGDVGAALAQIKRIVEQTGIFDYPA